MGLDPHERMTEDAEAKLLEEAVQTSYRRCEEEISILDKVSKQTVMKKIHALQFPPEENTLEGKKVVKTLFIDADEAHVALQYRNKKGDLIRNEYVDFIKSYLKDNDVKSEESIEDGRDYILNNWMPSKVRLSNKQKLLGCSAEGHVSHVLESRMTSRPMGWSKRGAGQMGRLRAY